MAARTENDDNDKEFDEGEASLVAPLARRWRSRSRDACIGSLSSCGEGPLWEPAMRISIYLTSLTHPAQRLPNDVVGDGSTTTRSTIPGG